MLDNNNNNNNSSSNENQPVAKRRGRSVVPDDRRLSHQIIARVTRDEHERLTRKAFIEEKTLSQWARRILIAAEAAAEIRETAETEASEA